MTRTLSILLVLAIALLLAAPRVFAAPPAGELGDESEQTLVYYGSINAELDNAVLEHERLEGETIVEFGIGDRLDER